MNNLEVRKAVNSGGNMSGATCCPAPQSQFEESFNDIEKALRMLEDTSSILERRLEKVLPDPCPSMPGKDQCATPDPDVPLIRCLQQIDTRIRTTQQSLDRIISSLRL